MNNYKQRLFISTNISQIIYNTIIVFLKTFVLYLKDVLKINIYVEFQHFGRSCRICEFFNFFFFRKYAFTQVRTDVIYFDDLCLGCLPLRLHWSRHSISPMYLLHKLFSKTHGFLQILRIESKYPKFLNPVSHFHHSKNTQTSDSKLGIVLKEIEEIQSLKLMEDEVEEKDSQNQRRFHSHSSPPSGSKIEIFHPWPEWVELMEILLKKGYFVGGAQNRFHFTRGEMGSKESNRIRTGSLNFARDRFDLIRYRLIAKALLLF